MDFENFKFEGKEKYLRALNVINPELTTNSSENNCIYGDFKGKFTVAGVLKYCVEHIKKNPGLCYSEWYNDMCCSICDKLADKSKKGQIMFRCFAYNYIEVIK